MTEKKVVWTRTDGGKTCETGGAAGGINAYTWNITDVPTSSSGIQVTLEVPEKLMANNFREYRVFTVPAKLLKLNQLP